MQLLDHKLHKSWMYQTIASFNNIVRCSSISVSYDIPQKSNERRLAVIKLLFIVFVHHNTNLFTCSHDIKSHQTSIHLTMTLFSSFVRHLINQNKRHLFVTTQDKQKSVKTIVFIYVCHFVQMIINSWFGAVSFHI